MVLDNRPGKKLNVEGESPYDQPSKNRSEIARALFEKHGDRVYNFIISICPKHISPDDVYQDTFVRILTSSKLEERKLNISYLFTVARNLLNRIYRDGNRDQKARDNLGRLAENTYNPNKDTKMNEKIRERFNRLRQEEQTAVRLIIGDGYSFKEVAQSMGVPETTVNNQKYRGLQKLIGWSEAN